MTFWRQLGSGLGCAWLGVGRITDKSISSFKACHNFKGENKGWLPRQQASKLVQTIYSHECMITNNVIHTLLVPVTRTSCCVVDEVLILCTLKDFQRRGRNIFNT